MTTSVEPRTTLYAEQEHGGIRMAVFVTLFATYILGFLIFSWFIRNYAPGDLADYAVFLSCVAAVPFALLAIWLVERTLKKHWHSGLNLQLSANGLYVEDTRYDGEPLAPDAAPTINWSKPFTQLNWYFRLSGYPRGGRERRVSEKWLCVCTELQQDETRVNTFTFMPPETAAPLIEPAVGRTTFHILNPAEIYTRDLRARFGPPARPTIPTTLLHSKDGRYWLAERRRWEFGIELAAADFLVVMDRSQAAAALNPEPATPPTPPTSPRPPTAPTTPVTTL